ncbi:MAG: DUF1329 domain-containing protein [Nevskiales bacterium]
MKILKALFITALLPAGMPAVQAAVSAEEAAKLGTELTSMGAVKTASEDGRIPAWQGEAAFKPEHRALGKGPDRDKIKTVLASMVANGKPLFVITKANYKDYAEQLTVGHQALFQTKPDYKMPVYTSVRGADYPQAVKDATRKNATSAQLEGTDVITGATLGTAFPIPQSGAEVIWNHKLRYRGDSLVRNNNEAVIYSDGNIQMTKKIEDVLFSYGNLANPGNLETHPIAYFLGRIVAPARVAGQLALVHEKAGLGSSGRLAWLYNPGMKRITRAPEVGYDAPSPGTDNEQFTDQVDVFNGALDRYNWKLIGRKPMFIPYNSTGLNMPDTAYSEYLTPKHLNQDMARYELHRVWVVEATIREGTSHQLGKRRFYVDEDSWSIAAVDGYDNRGELWKFQEAHLITLPWVPTTTGSPELSYDLQSGRYFATMLHTEDQFPDFSESFNEAYFTPNNLKRLAKKQ